MVIWKRVVTVKKGDKCRLIRHWT